MPRSKSSHRWLQEHFNDPYVKRAQKEGYRSRAIYKLQEIDEKERIITPGSVIVDLGAAPGGWSQYVAKKLAGRGKIFALDILDMAPLSHVTFLKGDFTETDIIDTLNASIQPEKVDVVLSDMAPNMTGMRLVDMPKSMLLCEMALYFAKMVLKKDGILLMKVFHGEGFDELVRETRQYFSKVVFKKPKASRARSNETYLLARGYQL